MQLIKPESLSLLFLIAICKKVDAQIGGPGVFSEARKEDIGKRDPAPAARQVQQQFQQQQQQQHSSTEQHPSTQQRPQQQQEEQHASFSQGTVQNGHQKQMQQATNFEDDFHHQSEADIKEQKPLKEHHTQQDPEHKPQTKPNTDSPLGPIDKEKLTFSSEHTLSVKADTASHSPKHEQDVSGASKNVWPNEQPDLHVQQGAHIQAPTSQHVPLNTAQTEKAEQQREPQNPQQKEQLSPTAPGNDIIPQAQQDSVVEDEKVMAERSATEKLVEEVLGQASKMDVEKGDQTASIHVHTFHEQFQQQHSRTQQQQKEQLPPIRSGDDLFPQRQQGEAEGGRPPDAVNVEEVKAPLTEEEIEGERLFQAGEKLINATYYREYKEAYLNFLKAAELNHQKGKEYVAFGYLYGDYLPQNVTKAAELFTELAEKGSPKAQMGLAFMYGAGFYYNSSQAKALIYSTFGALGGDPLAQMSLGYRYYAGIGVESKCETALTYYRKVAMKVAASVTMSGGPVVQRIRLQEELESQGTNNGPMLDDDLLQYYHFLADKGDQQAQIVLGTLYYQGGKGVQINHEQAYHYFSTAAESGSGHALGYLGKMHSEGSPVVTQNNNTAFEFFKKSADKNNHIGQTGLGMMYLNGHGVEKDNNKAFRYFSLASDQGSVDAQLQLGVMYYSGNGVRRDYKMAVKYFTMASQNGHVLAFHNLAQMHATGTGVLRNCHTAVELFKNVAERGRWSEMLGDAHRMYHDGNVDTALVKYMFLADLGYEVAQSNVAYMLDSAVTGKFGKHETHQRALLHFSRAASQGSTHARLKMGDYHYYGLGTDVDYESAASHYRMASEQQHNAQAMFNLGYMHEKGLGLKQDVHLAKRFYDMAAETSLDAHLPVTLALLKLGVFYGMDVFSKEFEGISGVLESLDPIAYIGPEWDLYLATFMSFIFAIIFFMRRLR